MNRSVTLLIAACLALLLAPPAAMSQDVIEDTLKACEPEIKTYCSQVTLGDGRLLACFYAHQDKISARCEYALYDAAAQLERLVSAMNYVASECRSEIETHCAAVAAGEGRIAQCLQQQKSNLSGGCSTALTDVGLMP
jgi:hypothetical protein